MRQSLSYTLLCNRKTEDNTISSHSISKSIRSSLFHHFERDFLNNLPLISPFLCHQIDQSFIINNCKLSSHHTIHTYTLLLILTNLIDFLPKKIYKNIMKIFTHANRHSALKKQIISGIAHN